MSSVLRPCAEYAYERACSGPRPPVHAGRPSGRCAADWSVGLASGEEVRLGPVGRPVLTENSQEPRREHHVAVLVPLALTYVDDHAGMSMSSMRSRATSESRKPPA